MIYGYDRVSTGAQDLTSQLAQLKAAGCEKVYREKLTGTTADRPQLYPASRRFPSRPARSVPREAAASRMPRRRQFLRKALPIRIVAKSSIDPGRAACI